MSNPIYMSQLLKNVAAFDINRPIGRNYITCKSKQLSKEQEIFLKSLGAQKKELDKEGTRVRFVFPQDILFDVENFDEH